MSAEAGFAKPTVQRWPAGVASRLPAASIARTEKVCRLRRSRAYLFGDAQGTKRPASSLHSNAEAASLAANLNVAVDAVVFDVGREPSVVCGAVASIVQP